MSLQIQKIKNTNNLSVTFTDDATGLSFTFVAPSGNIIYPRSTPQTAPVLNVNPLGSDVFGDGSASKPFQTMQKAANTLYYNFDCKGLVPTIQLAAGSYADQLEPQGQIEGAPYLLLRGDPVTPSNVILTHKNAVVAANPLVNMTLDGMTFAPTAHGCPVLGNITGSLITCNAVSFQGSVGTGNGSAFVGATGGSLILLNGNSLGNIALGPYVCDAPFQVATAGIIFQAGNVNVTGACTQGIGFVQGFETGVYLTVGNVTGAASGPSYNAASNSVINSFGGGADYFPHTTPGVTSTGGQYLP